MRSLALAAPLGDDRPSAASLVPTGTLPLTRWVVLMHLLCRSHFSLIVNSLKSSDMHECLVNAETKICFKCRQITHNSRHNKIYMQVQHKYLHCSGVFRLNRK